MNAYYASSTNTSNSFNNRMRWMLVFHFLDDETETQRGYVTGPTHSPTQDLDPGNPAPEPMPLTTCFCPYLHYRHQ